MIKDFILPLILISILIGAALYYVIPKYSIEPNHKTKETAKSIPKYKNAKSWEITYNKTFCLLNFADCNYPQAKIKFSSADQWNFIYFFYMENMHQYGWSTKSFVITSIPTSIVFINSSGCDATLEEAPAFKSNRLEGLRNYSLTVTCK